MKMNALCEDCLLGKYLPRHPEGATEGQIAAYQAELRLLAPQCREASAPEAAERMEDAYRRHFGQAQAYAEIKRHFNALMLRELPQMKREVDEAEDPLACAVRFAMAGNFIDFGAMDSVDEALLHEQLQRAQSRVLPGDVLEALRRETLAARELVYLTDNCGEIVADRLLIGQLRQLNPALQVTVIVRGQPVLNDATTEDAAQVEMAQVAQRIIGNGNGVAGTVLGRLSGEAAEAVARADLLIAKGQGNYESLSGCGLNVFYIFMCKCRLFTERFGVPLYGGVLARE